MIALDSLTTRQQWILRHIQDRGFATIEAMAEEISVSAQTVRRELIELERRNYLIRFHGGAGLRQDLFRIGYAQKISTSLEGKQRIAVAVAEMIPSGASVYLDVGSTVECVARALARHHSLHVVTPSVAVAMIFSTEPHIDTFVTGGSLRGANGALVGSHAIRTLAGFHFDFAVSSFGGFDPEGQPTDFDPEKIALRQAAFDKASRRIGMADATKFDKTALRRMLGEHHLTDLVVDAEPPVHIRAAVAQAGGRLVVADEKPLRTSVPISADQ